MPTNAKWHEKLIVSQFGKNAEYLVTQGWKPFQILDHRRHKEVTQFFVRIPAEWGIQLPEIQGFKP